jgi:mono/diheme cytochrome c family protein
MRSMNSMVAWGVVAVAFAAAACETKPNAVPAPVATLAVEPTAGDRLARGAYLVGFGGCNDCHTPKVMTDRGPLLDQSRLLAGHPAAQVLPAIPAGLLAIDKWAAATNIHSTAWSGPWGTSYATNLTPDVETGLGAWSEESFIKSMRTGKHLGIGRDILPPMPWPALAGLTDADLQAIWAYLRSLPAISNQVPEPLPPAGPPPVIPAG